MKSSYSTSEVMKTFALGRNTLRLYEEMGLLTDLKRTGAGYRLYETTHIDDLKFVLEAKEIGFTLNEIKDFLNLSRKEKKTTCGTISIEIDGKIRAIEEQISTLQKKNAFLSDFLKACSSKADDKACDVKAAGFSKRACCD